MFLHVLNNDRDGKELYLQAELDLVSDKKEEALKLYKLASEKGNAEALLSMGLMMLDADSNVQNKDAGIYYVMDAIHKLKTWAAKGNAYLNLFFIYINESSEMASNYLLKAGDYYDGFANTLLAFSYYTGSFGFQKNDDEAVKYLFKSKYSFFPPLYYLHGLLALIVPIIKTYSMNELKMLEHWGFEEGKPSLVEKKFISKIIKERKEQSIIALQKELAKQRIYSSNKTL